MMGRPVRARERHGETRTRPYRIWSNMVTRGTGAAVGRSGSYSARGIRVCDGWRGSYLTFIADMGYPPSRDHTLDRIDNDGDYEPGNCRWATHAAQRRNRSPGTTGMGGVRILTHAGRSQCMTDWARELGMLPGTLQSRLNRGWSVARALTVFASQKVNR